MKSMQTAIWGIILMLLFSAPLSAKMISGKVLLVDAATKKIVIATVDTVTGSASESELWINEDAVWAGADSLAAVRAGDTVWVEAEQDSEGNWKASKVTRTL